MDFYKKDNHNQYRPKIDLGRFLSKKPLFAVEFYCMYLFDYIKNRYEERTKIAHLSLPQRSVYCYYLVEGQILNGGFFQAISNEYAGYFPLAIDALRMIGQDECANLLEKGVAREQEKGWSFFGVEKIFSFKPGVKDELLEDLDGQFTHFITDNNLLFRDYIWRNRDDFFSKDSMPEHTDRQVITNYPDGEIYQKYHLCDEGLDGVYEEFFNNGILKLKKEYSRGNFTGRSHEYAENGRLKKVSEPEGDGILEVDFDKAGVKRKLQLVDPVNFRTNGRYIYWFENGNIEAEGFSKGSHLYGVSKRYYDNGQLQMKETISEDGVFYLDSFFLENGEQTLKDGCGYTERNHVTERGMKVTITNYMNGLKNGASEVYFDGILVSTEIYRNGNRIK